ncbi:AraC family transcriptional regulator [Pseudomonas sp. LA21]|uniref:helix-turn-helix domain-containing protein n=1 Tax=Pseudomonas sp. LA21 TaxID=2893373 RepID=UPI001FB7E30E|nr:AraC family transcriptional regulator [Pseudomonas sp. LA21]MCJ1887301.1 AraC family transcriptional regulator [Pseudomonas sp. LA21]
MLQSSWLQVREELGQMPILEGTIGGATPLFVERYMYQTIERTVSGLGCTGLVSQFGGGQVLEGEQDHWRSQNIPTNTLLVPRGAATHWHYSGTVDFAVFYFLEDGNDTMANLESLADARGQPTSFSDPLVGAAAQQLVSELHKGMMADQAFMAQLAAVMLEQTYRVLTTPACGGINPRHAHFSRLQAVLNHIHQNPAEDLSADALASLAGVSQAHFRRLFLEAVGMPPHRYVLAARLEQVRKLLSLSEMPLVRIAQECGFSSQSHLTACFRAAHAVTPAQFRARLSRNAKPTA